MIQAEDDLVAAIKVYVTETKTNCLDLRNKFFSLRVIESVLEFLPDTEVTELNLEGNDLSSGIESLCELLKKTKLKKLSLSDFSVSESGLLALLDVLKNSEIVDFGGFFFQYTGRMEIVDGRCLVPELLQSRLTKLKVDLQNFCPWTVTRTFVKGLPSTSFLSLQLKTKIVPNTIGILFSLLPNCQIKDLDLSHCYLTDDIMMKLGGNLKGTKVEKLNFGHSEISDIGLEALAKELAGTEVTELNLRRNKFTGSKSFGRYLKGTKIRILDLGNNQITHSQMFDFPHFLKGSRVEKLDVSWSSIDHQLATALFRSLKSTRLTELNLQGNFLKPCCISEFAAVLKYTSLENVDLSYNNHPKETYDLDCAYRYDPLHLKFPKEALDALNGSFQGSKLKSISLDGPYDESGTISCCRFLEGIKTSPLRCVKIEQSLISGQLELFAEAFKNSTFTHFEIAFNEIGNVFPTFVCNLKYTSITHLKLFRCSVYDPDVVILAAHLKETKIMELDLSENTITDTGAIALADCLRETKLVSLNLDKCRICEEGLEALAKSLASSFVTTLSVIDNNIRLDLISDWYSEKTKFRNFGTDKEKVHQASIAKNLLENQLNSFNLVISFKRLFPITKDGNFNFQECLCDRDFDDYMEECFEFYKKVVDLPAALSVLFQEKSLSLSLEELSTLLYDKFPRKLAEFVTNWVEADVSDLVNLLVRADKLGLVKIVEHLLLSRPLFIIDEAEGILHPYVYTLLFKYKLPLCNTSIEPQGISKIKDFFAKHSDLEGAADLTKFLSELKLID